MFVKGNKLGPGRPKGLKNTRTRNYLDIQLFAQLLWEGLYEADLTGKEKIEIAFRGINTLLPKINILPGSPADSVKNAQQVADLLRNLDTPPAPFITVRDECPTENGDPHP